MRKLRVNGDGLILFWLSRNKATSSSFLILPSVSKKAKNLSPFGVFKRAHFIKICGIKYKIKSVSKKTLLRRHSRSAARVNVSGVHAQPGFRPDHVIVATRTAGLPSQNVARTPRCFTNRA